MAKLRRCRGCNRSETVVFLSHNNQCQRCAIKAATKSVEQVFAQARKVSRMPGATLEDGIARAMAYQAALHQEGRARKNARKAKAAREAKAG